MFECRGVSGSVFVRTRDAPAGIDVPVLLRLVVEVGRGVPASVFVGTRDAPVEILFPVLLRLAAEAGEGSLVAGRFLFGGICR